MTGLTDQGHIIIRSTTNFQTIRHVFSITAVCIRMYEYREGRRLSSFKIVFNLFGTLSVVGGTLLLLLLLLLLLSQYFVYVVLSCHFVFVWSLYCFVFAYLYCFCLCVCVCVSFFWLCSGRWYC